VSTRYNEEDYETAQNCAPSRTINSDKRKNTEVLSSNSVLLKKDAMVILLVLLGKITYGCCIPILNNE
jgi:hypothetical protein